MLEKRGEIVRKTALLVVFGLVAAVCVQGDLTDLPSGQPSPSVTETDSRRPPSTPEPDLSPTPIPEPETTGAPEATPSPEPEPSDPSEPKQIVWRDRYPDERWNEKEPLFVLILGSDGRNEYTGACSIRGARADVIHLVALDPLTKKGTMLNFPRDSWVYVPPKGEYGRLNEGLYYGGPEGMVDTVSHLTGIRIRYYAITTFCGIINLVNAVGGIEVYMPRSITGANEQYARFGRKCGQSAVQRGRRVLSGCQFLVAARDRHGAPGGDFGRTTTQGMLLLAVLGKFREMAQTPGGMLKALMIVRKYVRTDIPCGNLTHLQQCRTFIGLANLARTVKPADIENYTLRGTPCWVGEASVVCLSSSNNDPSDQLFRDIRSDAVINGR